MSYTIEEVKDIFEEVCKKANVPVICPIVENGRLTRCLGRVKYTTDIYEGTVPIKVEFSKSFLAHGTKESITDVVLHEAAHYITTMRTGERHGHDKIFKQTCKEIGTTCDKVSTDAQLEVPEETHYKYIIYCPTCKKMVGYKNRRCKTIDNIEYYSCTTCGGNLEVIQNW